MPFLHYFHVLFSRKSDTFHTFCLWYQKLSFNSWSEPDSRSSSYSNLFCTHRGNFDVRGSVTANRTAVAELLNFHVLFIQLVCVQVLAIWYILIVRRLSSPRMLCFESSSFKVGASLNILCCASSVCDSKKIFLSIWHDYMTGNIWSDQEKVIRWFQSWWSRAVSKPNR